MALASDRQASLVDPSKGVYVEMEGIMEVRYMNEYGESVEKEDFYNFQLRQKQIPDDFCHKDRDTGIQAVFICLVCDCDLKSVKSLGDHAKGNKHIRKAVEKKRQILGQPLEPQNAPRIKKIKKEQPRIDVNKTLEERLRDSAQPAVGLCFVQEFKNPEDRSAHRMYSCTLEGCKSAWGTSDDIYNHVIKYKHARNFFKAMYPEDARIAGLSNADILQKATELHEEEGGSEDLDYGVIKVFKDFRKWKELRDRPDNWSEKKAKLGLVGGNFNSNLEPLGERKWRSSFGAAAGTSGGGSRDDRDERESHSPSIFDEKAWDGWKPKSLLSRCQEFMNAIEDGLNDVKEEVEKFEGNEESKEFKTIMWMFENYRRDLDLHENYKAPPEIGQQKFETKMNEWKAILDKAKGDLMEKLDSEEKGVKHVGVLLQEVEDEMENYGASRDSKKYQNLKARMAEMTKEMSKLKPSKDLNKIRKEEFNKRMAALWKGLEEISDNNASDISSVLESQMHKSSLSSKETAVKAYEKEISAYVRINLQKYCHGPNRKIRDDKEFDTLTKYITEKIVKEEVKVFEKSRFPWIQLKMRDPTKNQINEYLISKMNRYVMGTS